MAFMMKKLQNHIDCLFLTLVFLGQPGVLLAQENPSGYSETASLISAIFKVVGSLAVVVALMVVFIYLLKKTGINRGLRENSLIQVLETKMVAPKKYIAIVEIAGKAVSLGVTENNITLLTEVEPSRLSGLNSPLGASSSTSLPQQFAGFLAKATGRNISKAGKDDK
jgi:flagellar biosynthetic protein FliO